MDISDQSKIIINKIRKMMVVICKTGKPLATQAICVIKLAKNFASGKTIGAKNGAIAANDRF